MNRMDTAALDRWLTTEPAWRTGDELDEIELSPEDLAAEAHALAAHAAWERGE